MLWPQAIVGVVRPARLPTTPRWRCQCCPLIQGGELFFALMSLYVCSCTRLKFPVGVGESAAPRSSVL